MQVIELVRLVGWIFFIGGIILVVISLVTGLLNRKPEWEGYSQSKGIILIGPIPIVWGYGRKGWMIVGAIGLILLLVWLLIFL